MSLKLYAVPVVETRLYRTTYYVLAEDARDARDLADEGDTVYESSRDACDEVTERAVIGKATPVSPSDRDRLYRVITADGESYDLPSAIWKPDTPYDIRRGQIFGPDDVLWEDMLIVLEEVVPGDSEIVRVEVL